jgi:tryptophanyl-tRNA synthetase
MSKPVILTGLRANSDLHLGNYLGALKPIVDMANERSNDYQINLFMPDLHSFTTPIDHGSLQANIMQNFKVFVAAGLPLDNTSVFIYRQSHVPAHSELAWILNCFTGFGELSRMTEFKDKSAKLGSDRIGVGQFDYPCLMAADILLYDGLYVPVGEDQRQHIEFTRNIAERLNNRFGDLFVVPKSMAEAQQFFGKEQDLRVRDLQDPTKKMSKSDESGKGIIFMTDGPEVAKKKVMSAETDSLNEVQYDYKTRPGISNLLDILELLGGSKDEFIGQNQYGPLKTAVAERVAAFLSDFSSKLASVDENAINSKLANDEAQMNDVANAKLLQVQKAIGLR